MTDQRLDFWVDVFPSANRKSTADQVRVRRSPEGGIRPPAFPSRSGASRTASMSFRKVKPAADVRADPAPMRWAIIGIAIAFLALFIVVPLLNVFAQALSKGLGAYFAAISNPDAVAAIELTLIFGRRINYCSLCAKIAIGLQVARRKRVR